MYFVTYCAHRLNLAFSTINTYLYGIKNWQIGYGFLTYLRIRQVSPCGDLKGYQQGLKNSGQGLQELGYLLQLISCRYWCHLSIGAVLGYLRTKCFWQPSPWLFMGFYVVGNSRPQAPVFSLLPDIWLFRDVIFYPTFNSPLYMTVCCKFSKTDPFGRGHTLCLFSTHTLTCPVAAMKKYLSLKKYDPHAPLLYLGDGTPLTRAKFVKMLRSVLQKLGFQPTIYVGQF